MKTEPRLCELSTTLCEAWRVLYQGAFPADEREPEDRLQQLIDTDKLLLHKTLDDEGELLCFTMVSLADDFSFLAYMATNPAKRSGGWGTKHLKRLIEILSAQFPTHIGLFLEIEATEPDTITLSPEQDIERKRRLSFYVTKCGAKRVCSDSLYLTPSKADPGKEWEGELLYIDFRNVTPTNSTVLNVIREIYVRFYQLSPSDPLVSRVVDSFRECYPDAHDSHLGHSCTMCSATTDNPSLTSNGSIPSAASRHAFVQLMSRMWQTITRALRKLFVRN